MNNKFCKVCGLNPIVNNSWYCSFECKLNYYTIRSITPTHMIDPLKIENRQECDIWKGSMNNNHPVMTDIYNDKTSISVRKYLYTTHIGEIPENMHVSTICKNPRCVKLEHLVLQSRTYKLICVHCDKEFIASSNAKYCSPMCKFNHNADKSPHPQGCWLWKGTAKSNNYGQIRINNKNIGTHRFSYELHKGPIPEGMFILHSCDNPACVNPAHLRIGTNAENMQDKVNHNRQVKGEDVGTSVLTEEQVKDIYTSTLPAVDLAEKYNVSLTVIKYIRNGNRWGSITNDLIKPDAIISNRTKLTDEEVKDIYLSTEPTIVLSRRYNVSDGIISEIRNGNRRVEVTKNLTKPEEIQSARSTLTNDDVKNIYLSTEFNKTLAKKYNISIPAVKNIRNDVSWTHVTKGLEKPFRESTHKWTDEQIVEIYLSDEPSRVLAERYKVGERTIRNIRKDKKWTKVTKHLKK